MTDEFNKVLNDQRRCMGLPVLAEARGEPDHSPQNDEEWISILRRAWNGIAPDFLDSFEGGSLEDAWGPTIDSALKTKEQRKAWDALTHTHQNKLLKQAVQE